MRACAEPGCPELIDGPGYCAAHQRPRKDHQAKTAARGYGAKHRRWRRAVLERDPYCVDCLGNGLTTPATDADHIDGNTFNRAMTNGRGLCRSCHNRRTCARAAQKPAEKDETPWTFE